MMVLGFVWLAWGYVPWKRRSLLETSGTRHVRSGGGTPAARKYSGRGGRVEAIEPGLDRIRLFYVRIDGNSFETAFEAQDLSYRMASRSGFGRS